MMREDTTSPVQMALNCAGLSWREFARVAGLGTYTVTQFVQGQIPPSPRLVKLLGLQNSDPSSRKALAEWLAQEGYAPKLAEAQEEWRYDKRERVDWDAVRKDYKEFGLAGAVGRYTSVSAAAKAWCVSSGNLLRALRTGKVPTEVLELLE